MTAPLRVLHVFSTFVPAGPEVRTVRLIRALGSEFHHAIVAMDGRTDAAELLEGTEASWRLVPSPPRAGSLSTIRRLRAILGSEKPDRICTYNWGAFDAVMAAWTRGWSKRVVHHEDGFNADEAEGQLPRRVKTRRFFLPRVSRVVVPSANLETIAREHWGLRSPHVTHLPNGIDLAPFEAADGAPDLRAKLGIPLDAAVVGAVGHLRPVKNLPRLVGALEPLLADRNLHLVLLGDGEERAKLEALAATEAWKGRLHLVGHQADPTQWYRLFDVFAITSDSEQMPVSLLEAMATSLPVVATDVGDIRVMLPGEGASGLVALENDEERVREGLRRSVRALLDHPDDARELGRRNRERVEEAYAFDKMLEAYRTIYSAAQ